MNQSIQQRWLESKKNQRKAITESKKQFSLKKQCIYSGLTERNKLGKFSLGYSGEDLKKCNMYEKIGKGEIARSEINDPQSLQILKQLEKRLNPILKKQRRFNVRNEAYNKRLDKIMNKLTKVEHKQKECSNIKSEWSNLDQEYKRVQKIFLSNLRKGFTDGQKREQLEKKIVFK